MIQNECGCSEPCCSFVCERCAKRWLAPPGLQTCGGCGSFWVVWVNYVEWKKTHDDWSTP